MTNLEGSVLRYLLRHGPTTVETLLTNLRLPGKPVLRVRDLHASRLRTVLVGFSRLGIVRGEFEGPKGHRVVVWRLEPRTSESVFRSNAALHETSPKEEYA